MKTPVSRQGIKKYDHDPAVYAVISAWHNPGENPRWHEAMKIEVRNNMPLLARALDRLVKEQIQGE